MKTRDDLGGAANPDHQLARWHQIRTLSPLTTQMLNRARERPGSGGSTRTDSCPSTTTGVAADLLPDEMII
jgi:hypothetical protein